MARIVTISIAAVFVFGGVFGYLAWLSHAPESMDDILARQFHETMASAEAGDVAAQLHLGRLYEQGRGTPRDMAKAATWYAAAVERHDPTAHYRLGRLYEEGKGVRIDFRLAASLYEKAAAAGIADAQFALGQMHFRGRGVIHDDGAAIALLRQAAESGHPAAQFLLAGMYKEGWGLDQDLVESYKWYTLALPHAAEIMAFNPRYDAAAARRDLAQQMSRHQIDLAEGRAARFMASR